MAICFAADCSHRSGREKCSFYRFPQDARKYALWTRVSRRADRDPQPCSRLCSCHFEDGKKENGPSFFSYNQESRFTFKSPEKKRRKVLAIHREAGFLSDVQEGPNVEPILSSVQLAATIKTYSKHANNRVCRTTQDTNITEKITGAPGDINSAQVPLSSSTFKGDCTLPCAKSSDGSFSMTQTVSKNNNPSVLISNNNHFTLALASSTGTYISPVISNSSPNSLPKISYTNCSSLPVVSSTVCGSSTSSPISKDDHPSIPKVSTADKNTVPTQKVLPTHRSVARSKNVQKNKTIKLKRLPKEVPIHGRRIIDFEFFFKSLQDVNNHSKAGCNLNNMIITEEKTNGICTSFVLKCIVCNFQKLIWSENPSKEQNANTDFVSGILSIKCNFKKANLLLAKMCLPPLKSADFIKACDEVSVPLDKVGIKNTHRNASKNLHKNAQREPQLTVMQQCSSTSDNSNLFHDGLLIEDQFEIKEENFIENENESETVITYQAIRTSDDKLIAAQEKVVLNTATIKQETYSDDDFSRSIINETTIKKETYSDDENFSRSIINETTIKQETYSDDEDFSRSIINETTIKQETYSDDDDFSRSIINETTIKQETYSDDEDFSRSIINKTTNKENVIVNDEQTILESVLPKQNEVRRCEKVIVNEEQISLQKCVVIENNTDNNMLIKTGFPYTEITEKESIADYDNKAESELPFKKSKIVTYKKTNELVNMQGILITTPNKEPKTCHSRFESSGPVTTTSSITSGVNITSTITDMESIAATSSSSITTGGEGNITFLIPVQHLPNLMKMAL